MGRRTTEGKKLLGVEITEEVLERYREFVKGRGERIGNAVERALIRDMTYPPPEPEVAPLPDAKKKPRKRHDKI